MPLDTVLCLDTSGSMGWNNNEGINQLKAAALKFLEGVEETARQASLKVRNASLFKADSLSCKTFYLNERLINVCFISLKNLILLILLFKLKRIV